MSVVHIEPRERTSSHSAKHLRQIGVLPMAIVHPHGAPELVKAPMKEVAYALQQNPGLGILECEVAGGKHQTMLVKHIEVEPVNRTLLHMTLQEVSDHEMVHISVPVVALGVCRSAQLGEAVLMQPNLHIRVKAEVDKIPHEIEVDVSGLHPGDAIKVKDLTIPKGLTVISQPDEHVFFLKPALKEPIEEPEPAAEEPPQA